MKILKKEWFIWKFWKKGGSREKGGGGSISEYDWYWKISACSTEYSGSAGWYFRYQSIHFQITYTYRGGQFYWRKPEYPEITTELPQVTDKLYHIIWDVWRLLILSNEEKGMIMKILKKKWFIWKFWKRGGSREKGAGGSEIHAPCACGLQIYHSITSAETS
jgi:hypothetical protein